MRRLLPAFACAFVLLVAKPSRADVSADIPDADRIRSASGRELNVTAKQLAQMTALLEQVDRDANDRRLKLGIGFLVASGGLAAPSIYFAASGDERSPAARTLSGGLLAVSIPVAVQGGMLLVAYAIGGSEHMLAKDAASGSADPTATLARVEKEWLRQARIAHDYRRLGGILGVVGGVLTLAAGTASIFVAGPRQDDYSLPAIFMGVGAVSTLAGIDLLTSQSTVEASYATWKSIKDVQGEPRAWWTSSRPIKPNVGLAPIHGGGLISAGFVF